MVFLRQIFALSDSFICYNVYYLLKVADSEKRSGKPQPSRHMAVLPDPGSARGLFLLKRTFSFPLSPRACS